ncbi:MAG TPA: hypothetical protein VH370_20690 [Humisphaera sp.]|nr:hypothetical protein [Humisphaera sp.]
MTIAPTRCVLVFFSVFVARVGAQTTAPSDSRYFAIQVVDDQTGRGVPLVELKSVSNVRYWTDSAGFVAIDDPAFMNQTIFFSVYSHGYEFAADGFGIRGKRFDVKSGGSAQIKIHRKNIAERLYRLTGEGIYRDSVLLGRAVPIAHPLLNAQVTGQDSIQPVAYHDKLYWFWGDTGRQSYPLGHFGMSGATSQLPGKGGLDPSVGIDYQYFTSPDGFARPMVIDPPNNLRWADALAVVKDEKGQDRMVGRCQVLKSLDQPIANRLVIYNDQTNVLVKLKDIPIHAPLQPIGHPIPVEENGIAWFYFGEPFPNQRTHADLKSFADLSSYEGFTCLTPGARYDRDNPSLDRDAQGKLIWAWKKDTQPLDRREMDALVRAGKIKAEEVWFSPRDVETKKAINLNLASVSFNAYRKKWIAIASEIGGATSMLGEIWYSEADQPQGPWPWARKIITHDRYSFYNPCHHPFFDQEGGRLIYLEGTYATTFSRNDDPTPRYDYNQIMYRVDLGDARLQLP